MKTREKVIDAALALFLKDGFHRVTLQQIGDRVGISHVALYAHFDDKTDLLAACADHAIREIRNYVDSRLSPNEAADGRLQKYLDSTLSWVESHRPFANALLSMYYFASCSRPLRELHAEMDRETIERIETHLIQGNREGAWRVRDPGAKAALIHSLMVGEVIKIFHRPRELSKALRKKRFWLGIRHLINEGN